MSEEAVDTREAGKGQNQDRFPDWPKGCPIMYGVMMNNKTGRAGWGQGATAWGPDGHQSVGGDQLIALCITCFVNCYCHSYLVFYST